MSIMTVEMRGLGITEAEAAAVRSAARAGGFQTPILNYVGASAPIGLDPNAGVPSASSLLSQYGPTVGAGIAGLVVGLVLAKLARSRKRA